MIVKKTINGISCFIVPKKGFIQKQAMAVVRFGSDTAGFKTQSAAFKIPAGTAHFIEHLMFSSPQGNLMDSFSRLGAEANAFTAFDKTAYYFTCAEHFYENLERLIKMVFTRQFTCTDIYAERKIIAEEINMYRDDARWQCYFSLLKCLYPGLAVSNEIAGSIKDINTIDENILNACYDAFYRPENIAVIAAGDIDCDKICETVEKNSVSKVGELPEIESIAENTPENAYTEKYMDISTPFLYAGFKENNTSVSAENTVKMRIMLECMAGECSPLFGRLLKEESVDTPFGFEYLKGRNYGAGLFFGESKAPEKTAECILKEIENSVKNGFVNAEAVVKKQRGELIMQTESVNGICMPIADCFSKNIDFLDILKLYDTIDIDGLSLQKPQFMAASVVKGSRSKQN